MSSRRRVGLSEGNGAVPVDLCLETFLAYRLFDDIDLAAQNAGQAPFEFAQAAEVVETRRRETLAEAHRQIDVAGEILPACNRSEQGYALDASRAKFPFMRLQGRYDISAFHETNFAQLARLGNRLLWRKRPQLHCIYYNEAG